MKQQPEFELQKAVATYLVRQYPGVLFLSDARAFLKLTIPQAVRSKQVQKPDFACPDVLIFEKRKGYGALFIELKAETPFRKDGKLKKDEHLQSQLETIETLQKKGYAACFQWDFGSCKDTIDFYLK
jgi:hypothetical protein